MKLKISLLLIGLLVFCMIQENEGWLVRLRRIGKTIGKVGRGIARGVKNVARGAGRAIKGAACNVCPRVCKRGVCRLACSAVCRGKRDVSAQQEGHVTPMPNSFAAYDLNDNGVIDRKELAAAIGEDESHPDFIKAYSLADVNGDHILSAKEFYNGPFVFEMDLNDDDLAYCRYRLDLDDDLIDIIEGNAVNQAPNFIDGNQVKETGNLHNLAATSDKEIKPIAKAVKLAEKSKTQ